MPLTRVDILVWEDGHAIARQILEDGVYMIGRDSGCTLQLVSDRISREHARVIVHDDSVVVEDLASSNGIYFDGRRTGAQVVAVHRRFLLAAFLVAVFLRAFVLLGAFFVAVFLAALFFADFFADFFVADFLVRRSSTLSSVS